MIWINFMSSLCQIVLRLMPQKPFDRKSTLVQVMAWCHQAQAITWANVDPDLCHHMASWGHDELTHWGRDKMAAISQTTLSNAFPWKKIYEPRMRIHWSLFLKFELTTSQHWQRSRLRRPISKIHMILLMDAKTWMTSLIIMFAVRPICVQDSIFKMSSESPEFGSDNGLVPSRRQAIIWTNDG